MQSYVPRNFDSTRATRPRLGASACGLSFRQCAAAATPTQLNRPQNLTSVFHTQLSSPFKLLDHWPFTCSKNKYIQYDAAYPMSSFHMKPERVYMGWMLRYVTREPNLRVKRSCTSLGNLEVFLFVSLSRRTMFSDGLFLIYCMIGQTSRDRPEFRSRASEYRTLTHV
jgi:hypothetical protein